MTECVEISDVANDYISERRFMLIDRADIIIEAISPKDKMREPIAVIECKAPEITLGDEAHTLS